ncbi:MAG TPA: hypothetical protein VIJ52_03185 [Pseudolabrys sp.]
MRDWKRYERGLHHVGPHWVRFFGDGFVGTAFEKPNAEGRFAWYVADSQQPGAKTFRQGLAPSIGEARLSADAAVLNRKRGRVAAVEGEFTTSTDRNRRRVDRLLASETLARKLTDDLATYHQELVAAGDAGTADRIALSLRRAALSGLSDYMRRTATFRARLGPRMASPEEMQRDEEAVLQIADELDALADDPAANVSTFETAANRLRQMGAFPDADLHSAAVQSFLLKAATCRRAVGRDSGIAGNHEGDSAPDLRTGKALSFQWLNFGTKFLSYALGGCWHPPPMPRFDGRRGSHETWIECRL